MFSFGCTEHCYHGSSAPMPPTPMAPAVSYHRDIQWLVGTIWWEGRAKYTIDRIDSDLWHLRVTKVLYKNGAEHMTQSQVWVDNQWRVRYGRHGKWCIGGSCSKYEIQWVETDMPSNRANLWRRTPMQCIMEELSESFEMQMRSGIVDPSDLAQHMHYV